MLRDELGRSVLVADGALGTLGVERGLPADLPPSMWAARDAERVAAIHREYVDAGARILLAGTFGATRGWLARHGAGARVGEINRRSVEAARRGADGRAFVLGCVSPIARDGGEAETFERAVEEYREQIEALGGSGVDGLVVETMYEAGDLRAALTAARRTLPDMPLVASMTFDADGLTVDATTPADLARIADEFDLDAVGANCCEGPESVVRVIWELSARTTRPLWAKPSAGIPVGARGAALTYPSDARAMARAARRLVDAGATVVGGCCGTTPETIEAMAAAIGF